MFVIFKIMLLNFSGIWPVLVVAFALLSFFFAQLFLCLKTKRFIPKLIPVVILACIGVESFILDELWPLKILEETFTYFFKLQFFVFSPIVIILLLSAWLIARKIKKKKAQKQNSVTK